MLEGSNFIYIKKRSLTQWLTLFVVIMPFFLQALLQFFKMPGVIKYSIDVAWVVLLFLFLSKRRIQIRRGIAVFVAWTSLFFGYCLFNYLLHYQSPFYFLWGVRNNFRFYIAFLAVALLLEEDDIQTLFKLMDILFVINLFVSVYQLVVLGHIQDFCGGIFGVETGSNASTILFFSIIVSRSLLLYMNDKEKAWLCWTKCVIVLVLAAFAELKFFFVIFAIILVMASLLTRFSWKKTVLIFAATGLISFSGSIMTALFGSDISLKTILHLMTVEHYSSGEDLGRLTAIPQISEQILTEWPGRLFGLGLGNCDTSSFAVCNTPFFLKYQNLNYVWFSSAFLYLETGFVGLLIYLSFFVICMVKALRQARRVVSEDVYAEMAVIMAVLCIGLTFYNSSLRTEIGYLAYFVLALPFMERKTDQVYVRVRG